MKAMAKTAIKTTNQTDDFLSIPLSSFFLKYGCPLFGGIQKAGTE
jgi:hypothetical protein